MKPTIKSTRPANSKVDVMVEAVIARNNRVAQIYRDVLAARAAKK